MNIAFVVVKHIAHGGGIEKYTEELGVRLVQRGHHVRVYSMRHYGEITPMYRGMEVIAVPSSSRPQIEKLSASIFATIHASMSPWADIVHLHSVGPGAMGWFTRVCRKPSVLQFHGLEWKRARWGKAGASVLKSLEQWSVRVNRNFTAVSHVQQEYFRDVYGVDARYIPSGTDIKVPPPPRDIYALGVEPKQYVLFASRLVREKGAHYLIPAFRRLDTDCKLVIAGDVAGAGAYKQELLALAGGDPRIIFPGFVEGRLLEELFGHALVYVQPSEIEGLSIALLEAMSYGLCCLVSDISENIEAIDDQGVVFQSTDIMDLSDKLGYLLASSTTIDRYATDAVMRVRQHYSWDHVADEFEAYYQELLGERQRLPVPREPAGVG